MVSKKAAAKPSTAVANLLKSAPKPDGAAAKVTEADVLSFIASLEKGSEILKRARNAVWKKIAEREVDPEVRKILDELVSLKGFDAVRLAYLELRRAQPKAAKVEAEQ